MDLELALSACASGAPNVAFDQKLSIEAGGLSLAERLGRIHRALVGRHQLGALQRIAIATYDAGTDTLKTFVDSNFGGNPLRRYALPMTQLGSLGEAARTRVMRVVDEMLDGGPDAAVHTRQLHREGLRSSLTVPIYERDRLFGFVFFNANQPRFFTDTVIATLWPYVQLVELLAINDFLTVRMLRAVSKTAQEVTRHRDQETSTHLERMSHYARSIAAEGAQHWQLSDEQIEHLFWFAPLHDIGKVAVPDSVLLKPGPLTADERLEMQGHVQKGVDMFAAVTREFGMDSLPHMGMLRNVIAYHHESVDGSGYPTGARGDAIPIEGRIVAVADVFDALTSARPYKERWENDRAFAFLTEMIGRKFDGDCVAALGRRMAEVVEIQERFPSDTDL